VAEISDQILVMYAGRAAEEGPAVGVFAQPGHPYTWGLLGSMPRLDADRVDRLKPIPGTPPSLINVPSGCPFHPRCGYTDQVGGDRCATEVPLLRGTAPSHSVFEHTAACHLTRDQQRSIWAALSAPVPASLPASPAGSPGDFPDLSVTSPAAPSRSDDSASGDVAEKDRA
jgi:peptide/nickel transport system ATP-binding protein